VVCAFSVTKIRVVSPYIVLLGSDIIDASGGDTHRSIYVRFVKNLIPLASIKWEQR
jgi:hypothetical protein